MDKLVSDFDSGFQLGAKVEHEVAVGALVTALLRVLGKDQGDGPIDLGTAGRWQVDDYDGYAAFYLGKCAHAYLSLGDTCSICNKVQ